MAGLLLDDSEDGSSPFELPEKILNPSQFTVIYRNESGLALNNSNDSVRILTPDGDTIDEVGYEKTKEGLSYQRIIAINPSTGASEEEWQWGEPTAGSENIFLYKITTAVIEFSSGILSTKDGEFKTSKLETSAELTSTIFRPDTEITITYQTLNGENEITSFELREAKTEETEITIENTSEPLYKKLLPYLTTLFAVALLSLYEAKKSAKEKRHTT
ncbi:MAG: hypothetical protein ACD_65C00331G0001, partial [uncultured bacterium]